jgi:hypothetical protein
MCPTIKNKIKKKDEEDEVKRLNLNQVIVGFVFFFKKTPI